MIFFPENSADFSFSPTALEFSSAVSEITITVTALDDTMDPLLEPTEFIVIEVVDATSPFNISGAENARSVNITVFDVTERESLAIAEMTPRTNPWIPPI